MNDIITINNYQDFEQKFDTVMQETAERFVVIGYLLKVARDTDILRESGYISMGEFALKRYGLTKDIASRYIAINDRYSEGGYSEHLDQKYKTFGYAKLAEMLTLPDTIVDEITPEMTKEDIRAIKSEVREEEAISDIEVLLEEQEKIEFDTMIGKVLYQICLEHPEIYKELWVAVNRLDHLTTEAIADVLAPSGNAVLTCRIPGTGRLMVSIKGTDEPLRIINVRAESKEDVPWDDLMSVAVSLAKSQDPDKISFKDDWERIYETEYPKKEEVAPAQPKKVVKSVKPQPKPVKSSVPEKAENVPEPQIPGQMEVNDYPEVIPKDNTGEENDNTGEDNTGVTESVHGADPIGAENNTRSCEEAKKEAQKIIDNLRYAFCRELEKEELEKALKDASRLVAVIKELMG